MDNIIIDKKNTKMIAHRGFSYMEKENTMPAFIAAGNRSFYGIECDIHKTLDGRFVVHHDDETGRVSPVQKVIKDSTFAELAEIALYNIDKTKVVSYNRIPEFFEYLECCKKYEKVCVIEFKNEFMEVDIVEVLNIVKSYDYLEHCIFISFIPVNLQIVRKHEPNATLQCLYGAIRKEELSMLKQFQMGIDVYHDQVDQAFVDFYHSHGIKINVWTVNSKERCIELINLGVDFITTNIYE